MGTRKDRGVNLQNLTDEEASRLLELAYEGVYDTDDVLEDGVPFLRI
jgi:hypothetical protein